MENKWIKQGGSYKMVPSAVTIENSIPVAIYSIGMNMQGEFYLNYVADKFEFDFELLNFEDKFINHVVKSYANTSGNFGVLMNGTKGSGKTVSAKILANKLNLPVILVDTAYKGIDSFMASLNFECILFFDEYEKNFSKNGDTSILTIMDGVYNCKARKVFILTTNELSINPCLLSRPSRIRYKKEFANLNVDVVNHLFDKFLKDQSVRNELFNYVTSLEVCSVDIIKAIITEINIHGVEEFEYIKEIFNVKVSNITYRVVSSKEHVYDYDNDEWIKLTPEEVINNVTLRASLLDKPSFNKEEKELIKKLSNLDVSVEWLTFPCQFWNLKKGMYIESYLVVDVFPDSRIVTVIDNDGQKKYIYVKPFYNYNIYSGKTLI